MSYDQKEFLEKIIGKANEYLASDIHISEKNFIGYRVFGNIKNEKEYGLLTGEDTAALFESMKRHVSPKSREFIEARMEEINYVGFGLEFTELKVKFRVNVHGLKEGYHIVLRRNEPNPPLLDSLNFYEDSLVGLKSIIKRRAGLFLVVGQTGSGKSTTLAAMLREINENSSVNLITLEDPIEYEHIPGENSTVVQKELGRDFVSFEHGLTSILREDPDIILIGEIRNKETLDLALKAAETGHLVFATLHTEDTISTITRMVSMAQVNNELTLDRLGQTLIGVLAQKLEKTSDGKRILVWEQLITDIGMLNNIKSNSLNVIRSGLDSSNMCQSFNKTLYQHYKKEKLSLEEIYKYTPDKENLMTFIND